ncbi:hypothetical protein WN55_01209 [Dufourea novaeangliae]|uniref:MADF domain-containing protein n=1 Tax=Dufourea novaeangliae TaxID=178035 RepID=A0A154NW92_DUFNO|nr:hypothetical protein WN55_01209 [Dufourea novaeangliae]
MDWSREMSLTLVKLYKAKESLWNPRNQEHYQKLKRNEAWSSIAAELAILYKRPVSINDCKKKMDCILSSFRREKLKVKRFRNEKGTDITSPWFLFGPLSFLMDKGVHRSGPNILSTTVSHTPDINDADTMSTSLPKQSSRQPERDRVEVTPETVEVPVAPVTMQDECYSFGMFVTNKLRNYSTHSRCAVQHAISDILFNADMGYYDRATSSSVNTQTEPIQSNLSNSDDLFKNEEISDLESDFTLN